MTTGKLLSISLMVAFVMLTVAFVSLQFVAESKRKEEAQAAGYSESLKYQAEVKAREPHQHDWRSVAYLAAHQSGLGIVEVVRCPDCRQSAYIVLQPISSTATYRTTP